MTIQVARDLKLVSIESLKPYEKNARTHSDEQLEQIEKSIKEFGFTNPILVDGERGIIAGHGRLAAAKRAGLREVPVIDLSYLTPAQKRAYILADNKLALNAGWDTQLLAAELEALRADDFDISLVGFSDEELAELEVEIEEVPPGGEADEVPAAAQEPKVARGEVYVLGKHRLMCGDSTAITDVDRLLGKQKPDLIFTDPPYGIDYQDVKKTHRKIEGDAELDGVQALLVVLLSFEAPMFVCCNWKCFSTFEKAMIDANRAPKACIVWDKGSRIQNLDKFGKQHEFILYWGPFGGEKTVDVDVWQCARQVVDGHPTAKPVALIERALGHFKAKVVLDLFGGSGSTMIACESSKREARLMELDPIYCGVILDRWEKFTGKKAHREDGTPWSEIKGN
jgi:ParB-like chromosome segregation protein Spo0J